MVTIADRGWTEPEDLHADLAVVPRSSGPDAEARPGRHSEGLVITTRAAWRPRPEYHRTGSCIEAALLDVLVQSFGRKHPTVHDTEDAGVEQLGCSDGAAEIELTIRGIE